MAFVWTLIGGLLGAVMLELPGLILGAVVGFLAFRQREQQRRLGALEAELLSLRQGERPAPAVTAAWTAAQPPQRPPEGPAGEAAPAAALVAEAEATLGLPAPDFDALLPQATGPARAAPHVEATAPRRPAEPFPQAGHPVPPVFGPPGFDPVAWLKAFFTGGNPVVRVGLVVLFFGVAFLLKYAAERDLVPVELRYLAAAGGALALLGLGWYLRERRAGFALLLQGGAVGLLYLITFSAFRLHGLLPGGLTFGLLVALTALSGALAILQDSRHLASFGAAGGFLAPLLASTGEGNHVALFSYYALLNAGVLGIAWFRSWRELNLLGFLFTFVIGAAWGYLRYDPDLFASTEPFLVFFYLVYLAVAILYATRQPPQLRGLVDGSLVFGLPVVGFGLQAALVWEMEFGLAFSALGLAAVYLALATALWRRAADGLRLLAETFLALGVVFASLAIPFGMSGRITSAAWALEGAGLVWVGVRQRRLGARLFGLLLQLGAGAFFLIEQGYAGGELPFANGEFIGGLCLAIAGLVTAYHLRSPERLRPWEPPFEIVALGWGILWWSVTWLAEIDRVFEEPESVQLALAWLAASGLLLAEAARRCDWRRAALPALAVGPLLLVGALGFVLVGSHPFSDWGGFTWPVAVALLYLTLWRMEARLEERFIGPGHAVGLWLVLVLAVDEVAWLLDRLARDGNGWPQAAIGAVPALAVLAMPGLTSRIEWPFGRYARPYLFGGLLPVVALLALWIAWASFNAPGYPAPLPYLPLVNPVELAQGMALFALFAWGAREAPADLRRIHLPATVAILAFLALNGMLGRAVHHWGGVPYVWDRLLESVVLQAAFSVAWSLLALIAMVVAARRGWREVWFVGGGLLAVVVAKLFLIDLSGSNTVARIVSFLAVGALMLVIGYFSPLPPRREAERTEAPQ